MPGGLAVDVVERSLVHDRGPELVDPLRRLFAQRTFVDRVERFVQLPHVPCAEDEGIAVLFFEWRVVLHPAIRQVGPCCKVSV
jgi:hypothetical protein